MKKILGLFLIAGALVACERDTQVDLPPHQTRLVVHAEQPQNRRFEVRVGRSRGITEPVSIANRDSSYVVTNAAVVLKENNVVMETLRYDSTSMLYTGTRQARLGNRYTVEVTAPGFGKVESSSLLPATVPPLQVRYRRKVRTGPYGNELDEVTVTFTDDRAAANHYLFRLRSAYGDYVYCVTTNDKDVERLGYSEPFDTEECLDGDKLLVKDTYFNGAAKTITFFADANDLEPSTSQTGAIFRPTLEFMHINEDFFKYIKSVHRHSLAVDNPFAEPSNVTSNVKGGFGFFATFAHTVVVLQ